MPRRILLTLACLLMAAPLLSSPAAAEMPVRGMTLANTHRGGMGYGSDSCRRQLDELAAVGVNWVALCEFAWMGSVNEPEIRVRRRGEGEHDAVRRTIADAQLQWPGAPMSTDFAPQFENVPRLLAWSIAATLRMLSIS